MIKKRIRKLLHRAADFLELLIGIVVLLACIVSGIGILLQVQVHTLLTDTNYFLHLLDCICGIIIGVEFIKMLASHTLGSVIDVLLLALARQMVVEHTAPIENLLTILAVAILFLVRKYLYISKIDHLPEDTASDKASETKS